MDFMPLRLNSSSLTCSICALAAIILQLVVMECQKLHLVDSPIKTDFHISEKDAPAYSLFNGFWQSFVTIGSCNHLMRIISTYVGSTKKSEIS